MTDEAKRCVQSCREWYVTLSYFGRGNESSAKELLTTADLIVSLSAELEQVKRERDAAVKDMQYASTHVGSFCDICAHEKTDCDTWKFTHAECFEWRGLQEK